MKKPSLSFLVLFLLISVFFSGVKAQTTFDESSGMYGNLLNDLKKSLYENAGVLIRIKAYICLKSSTIQELSS